MLSFENRGNWDALGLDFFINRPSAIATYYAKTDKNKIK